MSTINNGGPAFPRPSYGPNEPADGMTLRDYFAGQFLATIVIHEGRSVSANSVAETCYVVADAMLKAREVQP